jgi:hypothetical protein
MSNEPMPMQDEIDDDDFEDGGEEWCDYCNNLGTVSCECGGDLCVCLNNGEMPCPVCESYS